MADNNTKLINIIPSPQQMIIEIPTAATTRSSKQGNLPLPLPKEATKAHIVPAFKRTLISIPQVVDAGYAAYFDEEAVYIINKKTNMIEWQGSHKHCPKLWHLPLQNVPINKKISGTFKKKYMQSTMLQHHQRWQNT